MLGIMVAEPTIPGPGAGSVAAAASEDGLKKIRKPYTITKSRESWTEQEHDKFLEALQLFDRDWKKIEAFVGSKSVIQIRSHAQKYFLKVQKNGSGEHVPPPRPKRKSAQPYPQKASKLGVLASLQHSTSGIPCSTLPAESGYSMDSQSGTVFAPPATSSQPVPTWLHHRVPPGTITSGLKDVGTGSVAGINGSSSDASSTDAWPPQATSSSQLSHEYHLKGIPDFAEIYKFIGSTFDPGVTGHLKKLKEMAPIDRETIVLLMRNLSINLSSPDFEEDHMSAGTWSLHYLFLLGLLLDNSWVQRLFSYVCNMSVGEQNFASTTSLDRQAGLA